VRANIAIYSNSEGRYSVEGGTQVLEDFGGNVKLWIMLQLL